jgi:DNA mismatch endonuclease (patch repair protein)
MTDRVSEETRSYIMSSVSSKDTGPELVVRKLLHGLGYRYRLHKRGIPGSPDVVFQKRKKVVFVNGCFWHGHECRYGKLPKSKSDYWEPKIAKNRERDERNIHQLKQLGWDALVIWQCQLKDIDTVRKRLIKFLGSTRVS